MKLIKVELVNYNYRGEELLLHSEIYIPESYVCALSKTRRQYGSDEMGFVHELHTTDGRIFDISKECYERIVGNEMEIPEGPEIYSEHERPKKPKINPGEPFKTMY